MTKHTPGPWSLGALPTKSGRNKLGLSGPRGRICDISVFNDEDNANARLIVAAPEMLAALTKCLGHLEANPSIYKVSKTGEWVPLVGECRAALAKARGT